MFYGGCLLNFILYSKDALTLDDLSLNFRMWLDPAMQTLFSELNRKRTARSMSCDQPHLN